MKRHYQKQYAKHGITIAVLHTIAIATIGYPPTAYTL